MRKSVTLFGRRIRLVYLLIAGLALLVAASALFEGPRTVYAHAIVICLDCIGLV